MGVTSRYADVGNRVLYEVDRDRGEVRIVNAARAGNPSNCEYATVPLDGFTRFVETMFIVPELNARITELANEKADLVARLQALIRRAESLQMRTPRDLSEVHAFLDEVCR